MGVVGVVVGFELVELGVLVGEVFEEVVVGMS